MGCHCWWWWGGVPRLNRPDGGGIYLVGSCPWGHSAEERQTHLLFQKWLDASEVFIYDKLIDSSKE